MALRSISRIGGWGLISLSAAGAASLWFRPMLHTGWGWAVGVGEGNLWAERDWYLIESDEWSFLTYSAGSGTFRWTLPPHHMATGGTLGKSVDLGVLRYSGFSLGPRTIWSCEVLLWPPIVLAVASDVLLLVSDRRARRRAPLTPAPE